MTCVFYLSKAVFTLKGEISSLYLYALMSKFSVLCLDLYCSVVNAFYITPVIQQMLCLFFIHFLRLVVAKGSLELTV